MWNVESPSEEVSEAYRTALESAVNRLGSPVDVAFTSTLAVVDSVDAEPALAADAR
jgi:hypothetical protein